MSVFEKKTMWTLKKLWLKDWEKGTVVIEKPTKDILAMNFATIFSASRDSLVCDSWRENREPLTARDALC